MKQGDYTELANDYVNRVGYSLPVLNAIIRYIGLDHQRSSSVADVGAGTGKLTENLISLNLTGYAIEPNDAMRAQGIRLFGDNKQFEWRQGTAECTGLPDASVDHVFMGSSFHWTNPPESLREFHRILKPNGWFTALWNPRDLERNPLEPRIEKIIQGIVPDLNRVSSGSKLYTQHIENTLTGSGLFNNSIFMEAPHEETMSPDRYIGIWRSVNDVRVQAGEERFNKIVNAIKEEIKGLDVIRTYYRTRAWTVQKRGDTRGIGGEDENRMGLY